MYLFTIFFSINMCNLGSGKVLLYVTLKRINHFISRAKSQKKEKGKKKF
jgi:hypothetical protein